MVLCCCFIWNFLLCYTRLTACQPNVFPLTFTIFYFNFGREQRPNAIATKRKIGTTPIAGRESPIASGGNLRPSKRFRTGNPFLVRRLWCRFWGRREAAAAACIFSYGKGRSDIGQLRMSNDGSCNTIKRLHCCIFATAQCIMEDLDAERKLAKAHECGEKYVCIVCRAN